MQPTCHNNNISRSSYLGSQRPQDTVLRLKSLSPDYCLTALAPGIPRIPNHMCCVLCVCLVNNRKMLFYQTMTNLVCLLGSGRPGRLQVCTRLYTYFTTPYTIINHHSFMCVSVHPLYASSVRHHELRNVCFFLNHHKNGPQDLTT